MADATMNPVVATILFIVAILAGNWYRRAWKNGAPMWQLWATGFVAAGCLLILAFVQVRVN